MDTYFDAKFIIETDQILLIVTFYLRKLKRNMRKYKNTFKNKILKIKFIHVFVEQNKMNEF